MPKSSLFYVVKIEGGGRTDEVHTLIVVESFQLCASHSHTQRSTDPFLAKENGYKGDLYHLL